MNTIFRTITICIICISINSSLYCQNWEVNPANYEFSMNIVGQVIVEGAMSDNENSTLGAFVEDNCVGVASPIYHNGNYTLFYITVYSASFSGSQISFKFKDSGDNITDISNSVLFLNDKIIGTDIDPFLLMDVELYSSTDFLSYSIPEQISDAVIIPIDRIINVIVEFDSNISALIPEFRLAPGATAYLSDVVQVSTQTVTDFTNPKLYNIVGADGSNALWTVNVSIDNSNVEGFAKNRLNIYPNPANDFIYIDFDGEAGKVEIINATGKLLKSQEVYFGRNIIETSSLIQGVYFVRLSNSNISKNLIIY